jgi:hypothetical protein
MSTRTMTIVEARRRAPALAKSNCDTNVGALQRRKTVPNPPRRRNAASSRTRIRVGHPSRRSNGADRVCEPYGIESCLHWQHNMPICRSVLTGATGLKPATSCQAAPTSAPLSGVESPARPVRGSTRTRARHPSSGRAPATSSRPRAGRVAGGRLRRARGRRRGSRERRRERRSWCRRGGSTSRRP